MRQDTRPNEAPKRSSSTVRSSHVGSGSTTANLDDPARHGASRDDGQDGSTDPAVERAGGVTTPTRGRRIDPRQGRRTVVRSRGGAGVHHGSGTVIRRRASAVARRIAVITGVGRRRRAVPEGNLPVVVRRTIRLAGGLDVTDVGTLLDDLEREARPVRQRVVGTTHLDRSREVQRRRAVTLVLHHPRLGIPVDRVTHMGGGVVLVGVRVPQPPIGGRDRPPRPALRHLRVVAGRLLGTPVPDEALDRRVGSRGRIGRRHDTGRCVGVRPPRRRSGRDRNGRDHLDVHRLPEGDGVLTSGLDTAERDVPEVRIIRNHHGVSRLAVDTLVDERRRSGGRTGRRRHIRARGNGRTDDPERDQQADHDGCERLAKAEPEVRHLLACGGHSPSPPIPFALLGLSWT